MAMRSTTLAMGRSMMPVRPPTVTRLPNSRLLSAATDVAATRPSLAGERRCPETEEGSKQCRRLRASGWVPGVMYGAGGREELVKVHTKELMRQIRARPVSFENCVFDLVMGDQTHKVVPRQAQLHPVTDEVLSVNFLRFSEGTAVSIPFRYVNEEASSALKRGSYVLQVTNYLKVAAMDENIPAELEVDLTDVEPKDVIRLSRVNVPSNVKVLDTDPNFVIGTVVGVRVSGKGKGRP